MKLKRTKTAGAQMKLWNFKGFNDWIEIFSAGKHTDSAGNTREWSEADLDNIIAKYDPLKHEAPIVVGHPKDNAPAFGWIESVKREGKSLLMKVKDAAPEFEEAVKKGLYKKRSVSFYGDGTLRHVGFLGAVPPAVKGLKDIEFNGEESSETYEFSESRPLNFLEGIFQRIREEFAEEPEEEFNECVNHKSEEEMTIEELQAKIKELEKQNSDFSEASQVKDGKINELNKELADMKSAALAKDLNQFCEDLINEGRLLPANKDRILKQLEIAAQSGAELNFSDNGTDKKVSALENLKSILKDSPAIMDFSERAKNGASNSGLSPEAEEGKRIADSINKN